MVKRCIEIKLQGHPMVRYPCGMRFPRYFAGNYPFRGRGVVSRLLYLLNKLHVDRLILPKIDCNHEEDLALFWPSAKRSEDRYYGYRIGHGEVVEYLKFGKTNAEIRRLEKEASNISKVISFPNRKFEVPRFIGMQRGNDGITEFRYEALPSSARNCPVTEEWLCRVADAQKCISEAGYSHGDFAWHNFKCVGDELWILDWEEMCDGLPRLSDTISLETSVGYYWRHRPLKEVLAAFESKYLADPAVVQDAIAAVRDLQARKMSMGDILLDFTRQKGFVDQ